MSSRGPRCAKHPSHLLVGVCAFCLRERLAGPADAERASEATYTHISRKKKQSPGRRLAAHGQQKQPTERGGCDQPPSDISVEQVVKEGLQDDSNFHVALSNSHEVIDKGVVKSVVAETLAHASADELNKVSVNKTSHKGSTTVVCGSLSAQSLKPIQTRGFDSTCGIHPLISFNAVRKEHAPSMETPPQRRSFSLAKKPYITPVKGNQLSPVDIKMPILENGQHIVTETKINIHVQTHASAACSSPLVRAGEQAKLVPSISQVHNGASLDSERNSLNTVLGNTSRLSFREPTNENVKDEEMPLSDASPISNHKKKTLSSLFSLDDSEFPALQAKAEESKSRLSNKGDAMLNGSSTAPVQNILHGKPNQRRCRHGSFSERVESSTYLFPVPETANSKTRSWLSALFRRQKKKSHSKPVATLASYSEHNNGLEAARQSWEAPRPSSWEQFRFSSFEGPRSSWEPARPSWEGVMRTSDGESVFSRFDFLTESLSNGLGVESKSFVLKEPQLDNKGRPYASAKASLMQRDVSTQTTPPRKSDATEIFMQKRLQQNDNYRGQHYIRAAAWSKVWTKTFSNSKWAFKHKQFRERRPKEMTDAMVPIDEVHDQGTMTSGRSSFHEGMNIASNQYPKLTCIDKIEDYEACDTFYSPLQQSKDAMPRLAPKGDACIQKDEQVYNFRGSNCALENGLLKFYLTPVRGHAKSKQGT
ncbi:hypothetical protein GOP47_0026882 [Adiantum capillus-veneris]|nr:hypothetical protein GOP47_0026882 [Adiantum capillus-veneris]